MGYTLTSKMRWEQKIRASPSFRPRRFRVRGVCKVSKYPAKERKSFNRSMAHLHHGALHRWAGIPEGEEIPKTAKKQEAANSKNPHIASMGRLALAMGGWKK